MYQFDRPLTDFERTERIESTLGEEAKSRAANVRRGAELALAKELPQLDPKLVSALVRDSIGDSGLYQYVEGIRDEPSQDEYRDIMRTIALADELCVASINLADEQRVREARERALSALSPQRRMTLARTNGGKALEQYLDAAAKKAVMTAAQDARPKTMVV